MVCRRERPAHSREPPKKGGDAMIAADTLLHPARLWTRSEVLVRDCPVPREPGVYAWYFREIPPGVPTTDCRQALGATLLYVGISPKKPPSGQDLRRRIRYHYCGNAEGSTLRLTLGCLLGLPLYRVASGKRRTFAYGEERLSNWMAENASCQASAVTAARR